MAAVGAKSIVMGKSPYRVTPQWHVIRPDGKLDSFCRYYSGFPDVKAAP